VDPAVRKRLQLQAGEMAMRRWTKGLQDRDETIMKLSKGQTMERTVSGEKEGASERAKEQKGAEGSRREKRKEACSW